MANSTSFDTVQCFAKVRTEETIKRFRLALRNFGQHCSAKLKQATKTDFVNLLERFIKIKKATYDSDSWRCFVTCCRCQILSSYAALLLQEFPKEPFDSLFGPTRKEKAVLACYSYSMIMQFAPDLTPIQDGLWWAADSIFCKLEAQHMLALLLRKQETKEAFFWLLASNGVTCLIDKSAKIFTSYESYITITLRDVFGEESCQAKVALEVAAYDSAIRSLMLYDASEVALKRLVWLWRFHWAQRIERLVRNDEESVFGKPASAPKEFNDTSFGNLTVLDISVFIHLSVLVAAAKEQEQLPFVLCRSISVSSDQEKFWASVKAYESGLAEPQGFEAEEIERFLRYIRLAQEPVLCRSLLHTVAKLVCHKMQAKTAAPSRELRLRLADYADSYWSAIEAVAKGEKRAEDESSYFMFSDKPSTLEENQDIIDESCLYRAKLLASRGKATEAEGMLSKCTSSAAATFRQELCTHRADSIDGSKVNLKSPFCQMCNQRPGECISEKPLTLTDRLGEVRFLLTGEGAAARGFAFSKKDPPKPTNFQLNPADSDEHNLGGSECDCHRTIAKMLEKSQQVLLKFGGLLESMPKMLNTAVGCIVEQNKQMMVLLEESLKSGIARKQNEAQALALGQYLNVLLNNLQTSQAHVAQAQQAAGLSRPAKNHPRFPSSFAPDQMQQFPLVTQATAYANTTFPPVATPMTSTSAQLTSSAGWPNTFNSGRVSQPPPATRLPNSTALTAERVALTGKGLFPSQPAFSHGIQTQPLAESQAPGGTSSASEDIDYTSKAVFSNVTTASKAALNIPPAIQSAPTMSTTVEDKGILNLGPTVTKVQTAATPSQFPALAKPATTTIACSGMAAAATASSLFGKAEPAKQKFDFGLLATSTTEQKEALPSSPWKYGLRPVEEEAAATKPPLLGGGSFEAPKGTTARLPDATASLTKPTEDVVDAAASHRPFGIGTTAPIIQPAVLSVPFGTGTPLFSFSTAKSDSPILRSSWPPTKSQEVPKEVPSGDQKLSTSAEAPGAADMKMGSCIPPTQFESLVIEEKGAKSIPISSTVAEPILRPAEVTKQASESEESEHEADIHYEPAVPLPELVEVITGEEDEEIIFKERARMFRYHKETKEYKECGIGDLKVLKHPLTNKYRMVMRRDLVHKICANQFLYADMLLKPLAKRENSYCWIGQDYSGGELVTALFAVRFRNEGTALKFKATVEECTAELKRQGGPADSREVFTPPSVQANTLAELEGILPSDSKIQASSDLSSTAISAPMSGGKGDLDEASPRQSTLSFGKGAVGFKFSFGSSGFSSTPTPECEVPSGGLSQSPILASKKDTTEPSPTALITTTRQTNVSDNEKMSDDDDHGRHVSFEAMAPSPDLIDVVTEEAAAVETVTAKFKDDETAESSHSLFMDTIEADQEKGADRNGSQGDGTTVEVKKGSFKSLTPEESWTCECSAVSNDSTRTRCLRCTVPEDAALNEVSVPQFRDEEEGRSTSSHQGSFIQPCVGGKTHSREGPSSRAESSQETEAATISADLEILSDGAEEAFQAENDLSPGEGDSTSDHTSDDQKEEEIDSHPGIRHLLQRYGHLLKMDTTWTDLLFKGMALLSRQAENGSMYHSTVMLKVERNLEKCPYGRLTAYNRFTKMLCYNHFVKEAIQFHRSKPLEWSWSVFNASVGHLVNFVASFPCAAKANEFLGAWEKAKGGKTSKLASSSSNQVPNETCLFASAFPASMAPRMDVKLSAVSLLSGAFSKQTAKKYAAKARGFSLNSDFFEYLLESGCTGCRACESFKEQRSPDVLVYDQICVLETEEKKVRCRIEVWYLDERRWYWTQLLSMETGQAIGRLFEKKPFASVTQIDCANRRVACNLFMRSRALPVGIRFPTESAFDEFLCAFLDYVPNDNAQGAR